MTEFKQCIRMIEKAIITEKQAIYLINNVLTPRLTYRLYSSFLTSHQLTTLTNCYTNLVKSKAKLSRGVPNSFLFHPNIYGLKNISQTNQLHWLRPFSRTSITHNLRTLFSNLDYKISRTLRIHTHQYLQKHHFSPRTNSIHILPNQSEQ